MNILVTGGAGYIGSHVVWALHDRGDTVMVLDNLSAGHREVLPDGVSLSVGDVGDRDHVRSLLETFQPDAVIHFAAHIEVGESVRDPLKYYRNNTGQAITLLQELVNAGVSRFIFSSTAAVYGMPDRVPIPETAPLQPINPYGWSKRFVEQVLSDLAGAGKMRSVALRYFNAAGADPMGRTGESHDPESHLIPLILQAASGKRERISIFGTDYPTPDGTCIRDYIHVTDLADAHLLALDYLVHGGETDVFNCGYGHGYSVREVIDTVRQGTGRDFRVTETGRRPGDPPELVADSRKLKKMLGWKPRLDDLETIVRTAWEWETRRNL